MAPQTKQCMRFVGQHMVVITTCSCAKCTWGLLMRIATYRRFGHESCPVRASYTVAYIDALKKTLRVKFAQCEQMKAFGTLHQMQNWEFACPWKCLHTSQSKKSRKLHAQIQWRAHEITFGNLHQMCYLGFNGPPHGFLKCRWDWAPFTIPMMQIMPCTHRHKHKKHKSI